MNKEIVMYTSNTWPHCLTAKEFLRDKGYKFTEKNLNEDKNAKRELMSFGVMSIPAFVINGEVIVGFNEEKIESLLNL